jgi:hypothetical protein
VESNKQVVARHYEIAAQYGAMMETQVQLAGRIKEVVREHDVQVQKFANTRGGRLFENKGQHFRQLGLQLA